MWQRLAATTTPSRRIAERIRLVNEDATNFSIQYPIRREHFQDSFVLGRKADDSDSSEERAAVRRLRRRMAEQGGGGGGGAGLSAQQLPIELPVRWPDDQLPSLYVHVPFCAAKCFYCNFSVDTRKSAALQSAYVDALVAELQSPLLDALLGERIVGIDIGGGTPTLLDSALLAKLLRALHKWRARCTHPLPVSIESTPAIAASDVDKLQLLRDSGVDRISIGLQSSNAETLLSVNRASQVATGDRAVHNLQRAGFARVCADLIFGLPGQTFDHWRADIHRVLDYQLDTITTYDCIYKGRGRAFRTRSSSASSSSSSAAAAAAAPPSWDVYGQLYDEAYALLTGSGYSSVYGSVNFSRHGRETGTSAYFEQRLLHGGSYVGVGNYASSLLGPQSLWWFAPYTVDEWLHRQQHGQQLPVGDAYLLPEREHMAKYLLASLSFGRLSAARFAALFGRPLYTVYREEIDFAVANNLLCWHDASAEYRIVAGQFHAMPLLRALFVSDHFINWHDRQRHRQ